MSAALEEIEKAFNPKQLNRFYNISLKHGFLYAQTPKVASSTLKRTLHIFELAGSEIGIKQVPLHPTPVTSPFVKPFQLTREMLDAAFVGPDFKRFCFVREPYTRVLSSYLDKIVGQAGEKKGILKRLGKDPDDLSAQVSFRAFVELVCTLKPHQMDPHWRPQFDILRPDIISYDLIGRLESFEDDVARLEKLIGLPLSEELTVIVRHRTSASTKRDDYYTDDLKALVAETYGKDFDAFGYPK